MKKLFLIVLMILFTAPAMAAIEEHSPTKVLVNSETGQVIFIPRDLDYQAAIMIERIRYEYDLTKTEASKVHIPSIWEILTGHAKGGCGK